MAQQAQALGLIGWVRNRRACSVEALATGPVDAAQTLINWPQRGSELAGVDGLEMTEVEAGETLVGFGLWETV